MNLTNDHYNTLINLLKEKQEQMNNLEALDDYNTRRRENYNKDLHRNNGISCPKCGEELYDSDNCVLTSNPPQKRIKCLSCSYTGYRVC